jgi:hypothetical protein
MYVLKFYLRYIDICYANINICSYIELKIYHTFNFKINIWTMKIVLFKKIILIKFFNWILLFKNLDLKINIWVLKFDISV